jgi:selenocysteine lyase/cysteine desulfurase
LCLQAGGLVLVDGAHAAGSIANLDIPSIGADFYTSNLHK